MIRWTLVTFAVLFVIGKLLAMSMQHDASYAHADAVAPLSLAPQCGTCGARSAHTVDAYGAAICDGCLRRIDANPREKRRFMFAMADAAYW
jgi:hypothetical protein